MAFERIQASGPELTKRSQPGIDLLKRLCLQPVDPALCIDLGFDETGLAQDAEVLGHRRLGHTELALDLSHRLLRRHQQAQDRAAIWLGDDFKD